MAATEKQRVAFSSRPERGQMLPLLAIVLALAAAAAVVVADLGVAAVHRAQARTAADAAALAGVAAGEAAARAVAADNGAELVGYAADGTVVEVIVRRGPARARATAEGPPPLDGVPSGVTPAVAAALTRAGQLLGRAVPVAAVGPGGRSVEVSPDVAGELGAVAGRSGLCPRSGTAGPVHFVPCPPTSPG